jgi:non-ribosomal peptide synthetase component F
MALTLHQLLTSTAARQPEHEAVRLVNETLTYGQLDRLRNQVAHSLIANSVTRGDRVGIAVLPPIMFE